MGSISYTIPSAGSTLNSVADPQIATALQTILTWANGHIDTVNLSAGALLTPPAWTAPTLINSWANLSVGTTGAGYLKDLFGFVHLRGRIKNGTSGSLAFTLPPGFRPGGNDTYPAAAFTGAGPSFAFVNINSAGDVNVWYNTGTTDVGLGGITFLAEG